MRLFAVFACKVRTPIDNECVYHHVYIVIHKVLYDFKDERPKECEHRNVCNNDMPDIYCVINANHLGRM